MTLTNYYSTCSYIKLITYHYIAVIKEIQPIKLHSLIKTH